MAAKHEFPIAQSMFMQTWDLEIKSSKKSIEGSKHINLTRPETRHVKSVIFVIYYFFLDYCEAYFFFYEFLKICCFFKL
jgi:hypothetical protein